MNPTFESRALEIAKTFIDRANATYNRAFTLPRITWDIRSKRIAGLAYMGQWRIGLNAGFAHEAHLWDDTIGHEIAHLVTGQIYPHASQGHGPEWKSVMRRLGLVAARCHSMKRLGETYAYECPICKAQFHLSPIIHKRILAGSNRICSKSTCSTVRAPIRPCAPAQETLPI